MAIDVPCFVLVSDIRREAVILIHGKLRMIVPTSLPQHSTVSGGMVLVICTILISWGSRDFNLHRLGWAAESHSTCVRIFIDSCESPDTLIPAMDVRIPVDKHLSVVISTI